MFTVPALTISEGPAIPSPRAVHAAALLGGKVVVAGGSSWNEDRTVKQFRRDTVIHDRGIWTPGPDLPQPFVEGAYASDSNALCLVGGLVAADQATAAAYRLAFVSGSLHIQALPALPNPLTACAAAIVDRKLFVACGSSRGQFTNQLQCLDLAQPDAGWQNLPPLPGPARCYPALTAIGAKIYLLGGLGSHDNSPNHALNDAFSFDTIAGEWSALGTLPIAGYCWSASAIDPQRLLLAGRADGQAFPDIYVLDLASLHAHVAGQALIQTTCAPLLPISPAKWWLISGEPDGKRNRTERITAIDLVP